MMLQGASWSSINHDGLWKPLHQAVASAFEDVAASSTLNGTVLMVRAAQASWQCAAVTEHVTGRRKLTL